MDMEIERVNASRVLELIENLKANEKDAQKIRELQKLEKAIENHKRSVHNLYRQI